MSPSPANRRVHPRARFRGIAVLEARGQTIPCSAGNLSESGMLLFSEKPIRVEPGLVGVVFTLPGFGQWLTVVGEVVHQVRLPTRTILGIHFTAVGDELRELLRKYVDAARHDLPPAPDEPATSKPAPDRPDLPEAPELSTFEATPAPPAPLRFDELPPLPITSPLPELPAESPPLAQDEATLLLEGFDQLAEEAFGDEATRSAVKDVLEVLRSRADPRSPR